MSIYLLNIPLVVLGIAIAVVPLIVGKRHEAHNKTKEVDMTSVSAFLSEHHDEEVKSSR